MTTTSPQAGQSQWECAGILAVEPEGENWTITYQPGRVRWNCAIPMQGMPSPPQVGDAVALQICDGMSLIGCVILGDQIVKGCLPDDVTVEDVISWRDTTLAARAWYAQPQASPEDLPWDRQIMARHRMAIYQAFRAIAARAGDVIDHKRPRPLLVDAVEQLAALSQEDIDDATDEMLREEDAVWRAQIPPLVCALRGREWGYLESLVCTTRLAVRFPSRPRRDDLIRWHRIVTAFYAGYPDLFAWPYDGHPF
jgi:hypothetical protein